MEHAADAIVAMPPSTQTIRAALDVVIPIVGNVATVGAVRTSLALHMGLPADGLDSQADEVAELIKEYMQTLPDRLAPEPRCKLHKRQYCGTWSHTDLPGKLAPRDMCKDEFGKLLLRLVESCFRMVAQGPKRSRLNRVLRTSVWEERHQSGMAHSHFPIQAEFP